VFRKCIDPRKPGHFRLGHLLVSVLRFCAHSPQAQFELSTPGEESSLTLVLAYKDWLPPCVLYSHFLRFSCCIFFIEPLVGESNISIPPPHTCDDHPTLHSLTVSFHFTTLIPSCHIDTFHLSHPVPRLDFREHRPFLPLCYPFQFPMRASAQLAICALIGLAASPAALAVPLR
jgi:hypothetical protein